MRIDATYHEPHQCPGGIAVMAEAKAGPRPGFQVGSRLRRQSLIADEAGGKNPGSVKVKKEEDTGRAEVGNPASKATWRSTIPSGWWSSRPPSSTCWRSFRSMPGGCCPTTTCCNGRGDELLGYSPNDPHPPDAAASQAGEDGENPKYIFAETRVGYRMGEGDKSDQQDDY